VKEILNLVRQRGKAPWYLLHNGSASGRGEDITASDPKQGENLSQYVRDCGVIVTKSPISDK